MVLGVLALLAGCAGNPWQSPESMLRFQRKHYPHVARFYPPGMDRAELIDNTRGRQVATIELPMDDDTRRAYQGTDIAIDLPIMTDTAVHATGERPVLVDVLAFFGGATGTGIEARYVFYNADRKVIMALGSTWED